jgi:C-terminal processing protease CtpA/Prc
VVFAAALLRQQRHRFFFSEQMTFGRDAAGYHTVLEGETYRVQRIARDTDEIGAASPGEDRVGDYLKLSVDRDGRLVYILGLVAQEDDRRLPVRVTLAGESGTREVRVVLRRKSEIAFHRPVTYQRDLRDGVTVVVNRNTAPSTKKMSADLERFVSEADQIAELDIAILDLRNHGGGQWQPTLAWAEALVGQAITYEQHDVKLRTRTALTLQRNFVEWYLRDNEERRILSTNNIRSQLDRLRSFDPEDDPIWFIQEVIDTQPELLPNDTRLFVLIDRGTVSAGEDFVHFLRQLDNVVFVGENTQGANLSGEPTWGTLPNSGFSFQLPIDATLSGGWVEGLGFSPDIWVDPGRSLRRVLRFLKQAEG